MSMSRSRDLESRVDDLGDRVRRYAGDVGDTAQGWMARGRRSVSRLGNRDYGQRVSRAAEDLADEANYQYRRLRRQVNRHPAATVAIVAGTVGAFLLLRKVFRSNDED
jgi:urease accessory protein UreF